MAKIDLKKYSLLFNKIPKIKDKIKKENLTHEEIKCLDEIYNYYNNDNENNKKKNLRKALKYQRSQIPIQEIKKRSLSLNKTILQANEFMGADVIFCYISFDNEINTYDILNYCLNKKRLCVPVIEDRVMKLSLIYNLNDLVKNKYGIYEPRKIIEKKAYDIDLAIVPGLAFNPFGYRIGYGGGYYDKFLSKFEGLSIAMVLKEFLITSIIPEKHDYPVNKLFIG